MVPDHFIESSLSNNDYNTHSLFGYMQASNTEKKLKDFYSTSYIVIEWLKIITNKMFDYSFSNDYRSHNNTEWLKTNILKLID